ncbi:MAG: hypothetical protein GWN99_10830, partial [Gemmatimonadetes bacterium]|nr:hypothetical protein [Gemmatimonadota bacterium]NIS01541.1 hypothetical protein [Gemmatimonadota bacterium]NIT67280.1 hypothetical protein [Gemmatimonadota bacterium]NIU52634.1 hypothetical protein [Gemmatimonadota bacterium]NIV24063.1 hypothetical protein [Gemmatimonadota bacterium]
YESEGRRLSYYIIPVAEEAAIRPNGVDARTMEGGLDAAGLASARGLGVAIWWDGEHQHALVGNLPAPELKRLAPLFACPVSRL